MIVGTYGIKLRKHKKKVHLSKDDTSNTNRTFFSCTDPAEETDWIYAPSYSTLTCNNNTYVGPFAASGSISAILNTAAPHNGVIVEFKIAFLDSWDGELFYVNADSKLVYAHLYVENENTTNTCGSEWNDYYMNITFGFNHSKEFLQLDFLSSLDQTSVDESWGICDLAISLVESYVNTQGVPINVTSSSNLSNFTFSCTAPAEDSAWTYYSAYRTIYCNGNTFVGPYGAGESISTVLSLSVEHKNVIMAFTLALIDSWDGESFVVKVDGNEVYTKTHYSIDESYNTCQNGWNDGYYEVRFGFSHVGTLMHVVFSSTLDQRANDEAWGICNLVIHPTTANIDPNGNFVGNGIQGTLQASSFSCVQPEFDESWSYLPYYKTTACAGNIYVGLYGSGGEISSSLAISETHKGIIVSFALALVDSWESETFYVTADDVEVYSLTYSYRTATTNTCQGTLADSYQNVTFGFNHTGSTLDLVFTSTLDQSSSDEGWGICDLNIMTSTEPVDADGNAV